MAIRKKPVSSQKKTVTDTITNSSTAPAKKAAQPKKAAAKRRTTKPAQATEKATKTGLQQDRAETLTTPFQSGRRVWPD